MVKHGSPDVERHGHRIEVVIELPSDFLPRLTIVNKGLGSFALGFHEVRQFTSWLHNVPCGEVAS